MDRTRPETPEQLVERWGAKLHTLVRTRQRTWPKEDVDDAVSMILARAWRYIDSYDPAKGAFSTWLYRVAHSQISSILRSRSGLINGVRTPDPVPQSIEHIEARLGNTGDGETAYSARWRKRLGAATRHDDRDYAEAESAIDLEILVRDLTPQEREVIYATYVNDWRDERIAREVGRSIPTVRKQRARALQRLRERVVHAA